MLLKYSLIFRYVFVCICVPLIHVFYSSKVECCRSCALLLTVIMSSIIMGIVTIINILKVLYDNYNLHNTIDSLSEKQLMHMNSIKTQKNLAIGLCLVISLLPLLFIGVNQSSALILFLLSGASPIPCCSLIDFLFYEEMNKKDI